MVRAGRSSRSKAVVGVAVVAGASLILSATPAMAISPWETAGYKPTCDLAIPTGATSYTYYDFTKPVASLSATPVIVVGNTPKSVTLATVTARDACSGVADVSVIFAKAGVPTDAFGGTAPVDKSHYFKTSLTGLVSIADAGDFTYPSILVTDRYEQFSLAAGAGGPFSVISSPVARVGIEQARYAFSTEKYASTHTYILKQTVLSQSTSKTSIKQGSSVTVSGKLAVVNGVGFSSVSGRSVALQYKSGSTWKTAASKATNASGIYSFTVKPSSTKTWRVSYAGNKTTLFYAPRATVGTQVKVS